MNEDLIYFKGKSEEKILKALEGLSLDEQLFKASIYNCLSIVQILLDKGVTPKIDEECNMYIEAFSKLGCCKSFFYLLNTKGKDLINILYKNKRVRDSLTENQKRNFENFMLFK
jgi:hypothetical protein